MNIETWFDPYNDEHIEAFHYLTRHGEWPKGFLPKDIKMPSSWHVNLLAKLANAWLKHKLSVSS